MLYDIDALRLGRRAARAASASPRACCPSVRPLGGRRRRDATRPRRRRSRSRASRATSRRRCSARRASTPGEAKNTYGTGAFVLAERRRAPRRRDGLLDDGALAAPGDGRVRARGRDLRRPARRSSGCATGSGSSTTRPRRGARRAASTRAAASTSCRRSPGSARRTGTRRARPDLRPHARHDARAHRARRARGDRVPGRATCSTRWPPPASRRRAARRRRRARQRLAHAVPGGRPRTAGRGAHERNRPRWARRRSRPSGWCAMPGSRDARGTAQAGRPLRAGPRPGGRPRRPCRLEHRDHPCAHARRARVTRARFSRARSRRSGRRARRGARR